MKPSIALVGLAALIACCGTGTALADSGSRQLCTTDSIQTGFQILDADAVRTAPHVNIVQTRHCYGFAASVRYDPLLSSEINSNPAYHAALRLSGAPNTDIYGATLDGDVLTVYIKDNT